MLDAYVARPGEFFEAHRCFLVYLEKLLDPAADGPLWTELREDTGDLIAVDAVAAKIRAAALSVLDATPGHDFLHHGSYITDLVVLLSATDIKCLIMNQF